MKFEGLKSNSIIYIIISVFIFVRLIHLDSDAPPFELMNLQAIDEFYYSIASFNLVHFGTFINIDTPHAVNDTSPFMLLFNFFTTISLTLFGNNYYGLRFGSGLCSLLGLLFLINCIKKTSSFKITFDLFFQKNGLGFLLLILLLFFSLDFSFLIISRFSEPTVSRTLMIIVMIWYMASYDNTLKNRPYLFAFLFGFLSLFSVCFVYVYNLFFAGAAGITLLMIALKDKKNFKFMFSSISFFLLGCLICCFLYEGFIQFFCKRSFFDYSDMLAAISDGRVKKTDTGIIALFLKLKNTILADLGTNMFRLNLPFLLLTLLALPVYFYRTFKFKKNIDIFIFSLFTLWFLQSFFENSYPLKRHTIMFPVFILILIYSFEDLIGFLDYLKQKNKWKIAYSIYMLCAIGVVFFTSYVFYKTYKNNFNELLSFSIFNFSSVILTIFIIGCAFFSKAINTRLLYFCSLMLLLPSSYLFVNKIIINSTYMYKESMLDMGQYINNKIMPGGASYAFRLYNTSEPTLNTYVYMYNYKKEFKSRRDDLLKTADYFIMTTNNIRDVKTNYVSPMEIGYLNQVYKETGYTFKMVKWYNIGDRIVFLVKKQNKKQLSFLDKQ